MIAADIESVLKEHRAASEALRALAMSNAYGRTPEQELADEAKMLAAQIRLNRAIAARQKIIDEASK